jgi:diaminohydroxyphosphoribosylaminopyrimidine deaminase/5-amino-6-(5-phosphoribosylamino)uracil reductase
VTTVDDAMRRAVALGALGLGATSPNPSVGAVILDAGGALVG